MQSTYTEDPLGDLTQGPQRVNIPDHGIYFRVRGQLWATPTPSFFSVPVEFAGFMDGDCVNGPKRQIVR